ncbi:MAG: PPA1309 family protein [Actinomycetaceae bacterium]|nr:PPA1309 family protein [Actinomycetaceae bacterium]
MTELPSSPSARALAQAVVEIEQAASAAGWDHAATIYALVPTQVLLQIPELPADMEQYLQAQWDGSENHLTAVIQEDLPGEDLEETLSMLAWPDEVVGAAVCSERVTVPQEVQDAAPADAVDAAEFFANHPQRDELRVVAGVSREGDAWCAVRARSHDADGQVATGPDLVPGLVEALLATFAPAYERGRGSGCCGGNGGGGCGCGQPAPSSGGCSGHGGCGSH